MPHLCVWFLRPFRISIGIFNYSNRIMLKTMHMHNVHAMVSASAISVEFPVGFLPVFGCLFEDVPSGVFV